MLSATPYIAMILFSLALTESRSINGPNPTITEGVHSRLKRMAIVVQLKRTNSGDKVDECTSAKTEYKDLTVMVQKMGLESDIIKWRNLILKQYIQGKINMSNGEEVNIIKYKSWKNELQQIIPSRITDKIPFTLFFYSRIIDELKTYLNAAAKELIKNDTSVADNLRNYIGDALRQIVTEADNIGKRLKKCNQYNSLRPDFKASNYVYNRSELAAKFSGSPLLKEYKGVYATLTTTRHVMYHFLEEIKIRTACSK